ncbi:MAG TPA: hypothetical protein VJS38_15520 [Phenylobacterium sp.]|uniref:hypothetical protein n=1 Tax=Phenylobacterium sp. TaxID=1871053 RepID=UPI002B48CC04|nr:hypothetical protein [Phenylobacterium sp.]HKR89582.1 hypothetical protein [Phenylobacterium sp.]
MSPSPQPLSRTLGACAGELAALADRCEALQAGLAPALQSGAAIEEAQTLDLLTQSLAAVADYLHALSASLPAEWLVDPAPAAAIVPLTELARRLTGAALLAPPESGELDLFGACP